MSKELEMLREMVEESSRRFSAGNTKRLRAILARLEAAERVAHAAWAYHATQPEQSVRAMKGRGNALDEAIRAYRALDTKEPT